MFFGVFFVLILSLHKLINSRDSHVKLLGHEITIMGFLTVFKASLQEFNVYGTDEQKRALVPVRIV